MPKQDTHVDTQVGILTDLESLERKPYSFVLWAYPWGEVGTDLESFSGPEDWQKRVLLDLQNELLAGVSFTSALSRAYLIAVKSGKNVGKSALLSWLIWWGFSTRVNTKGRATANTKTQISTILWAELAKWHRLFIAHDFFEMTATRITTTDPNYRKEWGFDAIPWSKDNPDAWAGLHNQGGRVIMVFDEAAEIDDSIWERADGATREANTEVFWIVTSNPTRNFGRFFECFNVDGKHADLWHRYTVDSREVRLTNHDEINRAIEQWGEDDDYTRVQFLGLFPSSSFFQLISKESVDFAMGRINTPQEWEPLILGVDVARYGDNESVACFRRGRDNRSIPVQRRRGLSVPECADWVASLISLHSPDQVFIDEGGVGGGVLDVVQRNGHNSMGVQFGGKPSGITQGVKVADKRAEMFILLRDWIRTGGVMPKDPLLSDQLTSLDYHVKKDVIRLMSKEDMRSLGKASPDWADALALTFAYPVTLRFRNHPGASFAKHDYNPLDFSALPSVNDNVRVPQYQGWGA